MSEENENATVQKIVNFNNFINIVFVLVVGLVLVFVAIAAFVSLHCNINP
jgi:hypothetical protein